MRFRPEKSVGPALALALVTAMLGVAGTPATPALGSCANMPLVATMGADDRLFVGTVIATDASSSLVRIDRWLSGPQQAGTVVVRGRQSPDPDTWTSVDWEPAIDASYVISATADEDGVLKTSACRVVPLTPEVRAEVERTWPSASPAPAPSAPPISASVEDETFRLTITTPRSTYTTTEAIPISATLELLRTEPTTIAGPGSGPLGFGIEQLDGPIDTQPGWRASCGHDTWAPGEVRTEPFAKSGGFSADDPMAGFWRAYFDEPDLILPAGQYRVFAVVDYDLDDCSIDESILTAEVRFDVVEPSASPSPGG
jgi:hypothetical protein